MIKSKIFRLILTPEKIFTKIFQTIIDKNQDIRSRIYGL